MKHCLNVVQKKHFEIGFLDFQYYKVMLKLFVETFL